MSPSADDRPFNRELRVVRFIATSRRDEERGPLVCLHTDEARKRLLNDGELAWVYGPRRHDLAEVRIDDSVGIGEAILRDIAGVAPSELVRVVKPDLDTRGRRPATLA
jgi:hypothetical protein